MGKVIKTIAASISLSLILFCLGCGSGITGPAVPSLSQVTPQTIPAGSQSMTLKVKGANFTSQVVILWNGIPLATTVVDANDLIGTIGSTNLSTPSTAKLQVQNQETLQASQSLPVVVSAVATGNTSSPLVISTVSLPQAVAGTQYSATMTAAGGTAPYSWNIVSGELPAGLTLSTSTGVITGIPTTGGSYSFGISVTDSSATAQSTTATMSLTVAAAPGNPTTPLTITSSALPPGTSGTAYSTILQATGGTAPYSWAILTGNLPAGLGLSANTGSISGVPAASGSFPITVMVQDSASTPQTSTASLSLSIVAVDAPLSITSSALPGAMSNQPYSATLNAVGGTAPYVWSLSAGSLPSGINLAPNGSLFGTSTTSGTFDFSATVVDSSSPAQTKSAAFSLVVAPTLLNITSSALPAGTIGSNYLHALQATGGTAPYTWSVTAGNLPTGLSLTPSGSVLGIPTVSGTFNFTATVADSANPAQTKSVQVSLVIAPATLTITSSTLPVGTTGTGYSNTLLAAGGTAPYTWSLAGGNLPAGLTLAPGGTVSGTPTVSGTFNFTATVADSASPAQSRSIQVSLIIVPATLTITSSNLPSGTSGSAYSNALEAIGGTAPYTWSIAGGNLPAGLSLGAVTGIVSGTPTASGTFSFTAAVADAASPSQTKSVQVSLVIAPATLTIITSALPSGTQNSSYSGTLRAKGGTPPFTWSIAGGSLPAGLNLGATMGLISGSPTASGDFSVTLMVKDSATSAQTATVTLPLSVVAAGSPLAITSSTLHGGITNTLYSASLNATGGTAPYIWSIAGGSLPSGFSLAANTGVISGTPTSSGTFSFTASVADASNPTQTKSAVISFVIAPPALTIATSYLPSGTQGLSYSNGFVATGGTAPYLWSITGGSLPSGLSLGATTGIVSGAPTVSGTFNITATVADASSPAQTKSVTVSIVIAPPALAILSSALPSGTQGTSYSGILQATGGTTPYNWSITSGNLPAGLNLSATTGLISGSPSASGTFNITATVTDSSSPTQSKSTTLSIAIAPPALTLTTTSLPSGTQGTNYSSALLATGGTAPYTWSITSGSLPAGLNLSVSTGLISGTPIASGTFNITATVADSGNPAQTKSAAFAIVIAPPALVITSSSLPAGIQGANYSSALLATGGTAPYTWSITSGSLPAGLNLASTGLISGAPTVNGTFNLTATITDSSNPAQSKSVALALVIAPPALIITTSSLPAGTQNVSYSKSLLATGGTAPYTWSIASGSLPAGLNLASTGLISGTPTASGTFNVTATITDSSNPAQSKSVALALVIAPPALAVTTSSLPSGNQGTNYSSALLATSGTAPYTWSITTGSLPSGISLVAGTGILSGTPTTNGTFNFTATITDSSNPAQSKSVALALVIAPAALTITTSSLPSGTQGTNYSNALLATGGTAPYTWSITSGNLPAGVSLSASTGLISGSPTANGIFNVTATVTDSTKPTQSKSVALALVIAPPALAITTSSLPSGTQSVSYSKPLQATGGTAPYTWSITTGSLPSGISLAASTGILSGTPTANGTFNITATVTDSSSPAQSKSVALSLVIAPPALTVTTSSIPSGTQGTSYSKPLQAAGGTAPYTWSITTGSLPSGLSLSASTGMISGTPTASGNFPITVAVKDSSSVQQSATASLPLTITAATTPLAISTTTLAAGVTNQSYTATLSASGGTTPYSWSITAGSLPSGISLAASTGILSGKPTSAATDSITVTVTDSSSPALTKSATLSLVVTVPALIITTGTLPSGTDGTAYSSPMSATGGTPAYTWSITSGSLPAGLTLAATTGIISGSPTATGTSTFTATVTDNSNPAQTKSAPASITIAAAIPTGPGTTWYIRADGGTRYSSRQTQGQCDGKADVAYSGTGTNQHCAFNDYRYLWDDQSYGNDAWVIAGGDTVIIRNGPWRVGYDSGSGSSNTWCFGGDGTFGCFNPTIPAGTAGQHTRILGENYGSCGSKTSMTQIYGGYGVEMALNLDGAQYVDVECIELTRHSQCTQSGSPQYPAGCSTNAPISDYASSGIFENTSTHDVLLQDMWIHGFPSRGIIGPIGGTMTATRVDIAYNGMAGWDFDDGSSTKFVNAVWNFNYSTIEWNGCNQEYPIVHTFPLISCYGQSNGGYGDGVGTPAGTGLTVNVDHSVFRYNTQDGLDVGHVDTGGPYALNITNSTFYGNNGGAFKWGPNFMNVVIENNVALANCSRLSAPMAGAPSTYNANLGDFCRSGDAISFNFRQGGTTLIANNTFATYAATTFDIQCWDAAGEGSPGDTGVGCAKSSLTVKNNVILAYANPNNDYGGNGGPGMYYFRDPIGTVVRSNNLYYGLGHGFSCPTGYAGEICTSPLLVNQPIFNGESSLDNFNFDITPGSPVIGAGVAVPGLTLDFTGATRGTPPSIGAYEK